MAVTFEQATLDNGLTIVSETDTDAHTAAMGFFVRTGARDEGPEVMGVSHFLEHMMFKGTAKRSADDINREFDEIGANYNAYTSNEITCYYAQVLPEHLQRAADLLADMLRPALRDDDFTAERGVILEEIAMYKDNPFWVLYDQTLRSRYPNHPMGHLVLGTTESVTAMQRDQMRAYFDQRYSADNTVVALAGNLDFGEVVAQLTEACARWTSTGATRDNTEPPAAQERFTLRDDKVNRCYALMMTPAPAMQDERRYAASILAKALGGPDNSRLHWSLLETGVAEEAQASYEPHDGGGNYMVFATCEPDRIDEVLRRVDEEIDKLLDTTAEDLERLRSKSATAITLAGERPNGRMQRLGRYYAALREHRTLEEELDRLSSVTLKDLRAVYEAFPFTPRTVGVLTPKG